MTETFAATVGGWCDTVQEVGTAIFQESAQELVKELDTLISQVIYSNPATDQQRTGFLRASLVASNSAMPVLNRANPGTPVAADYGDVLLVINGTDLGEPLYLGYTAEYGLFVHYGTSKMPGRPWVDLVAQRWTAIVAAKEAEVRTRFGL
jgi:hypothetical protein